MAQVKGKGSIIALEKPERTCKKWQLRVSIGRDYVTNNYVTKTRRVNGTKTKAQKELRAFINELESGIRTDTIHLTFGEYAEKWLDERVISGEISKGTERRLDYHIRTLCKHLGSVKVVDINAETVSSLYIALRNGGSLEGQSLTGTSINHMAVTLNTLLEDAVTRDIIIKNPCRQVKKPKRDTKEKEALSEKEAKRLLSLLTKEEPTSFKMGIMLALCCGLRSEEVIGLRWCDFNEQARTIKINHAFSRDSRMLKEPKTKTSKRTIPLDDGTFKRLEEWRNVQAKYLISIGNPPKKTTPIITTLDGGFVYHENLFRWWNKFRKKNGFEHFSIHQLRHTYATMLVANGVDIVTAKTLMGHSDTKMLLELYAHVVPENMSKASELIGGILHGDETSAKVIDFETMTNTA